MVHLPLLRSYWRWVRDICSVHSYDWCSNCVNRGLGVPFGVRYTKQQLYSQFGEAGLLSIVEFHRCTVGLKDAVTAIAFVALGTSVPGKKTQNDIVLNKWRIFVEQEIITHYHSTN